MGITVSLILLALGAALLWAVNISVAGVSLDAVGVILMIVGGIGLILSMIYWSSWGGFTRSRTEYDVRP
jgi:hypothetical protein